MKSNNNSSNNNKHIMEPMMSTTTYDMTTTTNYNESNSGSERRPSPSSTTATGGDNNNNNNNNDVIVKTTTTTTTTTTPVILLSSSQKRRKRHIQSKRERYENNIKEIEAAESNKNHDDYLIKSKSRPDSNNKRRPARMWLYDRIYGKSKINPTSRPPCCCCYVPPPVGFCPSFTEENVICRFWGKLGIIQPTNEYSRYWILHIGFWANFIGFVLTFVSAFSISTDYNILKSTSFSRTILTGRNISKTQELLGRDYILQVDVGLRGVGFDLPGNVGLDYTTTKVVVNEEDSNSVLIKYANVSNFVVDFNEFCNFPSHSFISHMNDDAQTANGGGEQQCTACGEVSNSMVVTVIMSTITYLPSFATDILRMYSNYDVNCQKSFATIFATLTLLLSINTLLTYNNACFASFYEGFVPLTAELEVPNNEEDAIFNIHFDWFMGPGLTCLYCGTVLKIVDIICNLLVPTPTITRSNKEKYDYEQLSPYPPYNHHHNNNHCVDEKEEDDDDDDDDEGKKEVIDDDNDDAEKQQQQQQQKTRRCRETQFMNKQ